MVRKMGHLCFGKQYLLTEKKENKAIEHYSKFLNLWKDADPGIPEVEDVMKKPAGLRGN